MQDVEGHAGQLSAQDECSGMVSLEVMHAHKSLEMKATALVALPNSLIHSTAFTRHRYFQAVLCG